MPLFLYPKLPMALDSSFRYGYIRKYSIVPQTDPALQDIDGPILPIKIRIFRKRIVCKVVPPKAIAPIVDAAILSKDGKQVRTRRKRKLTPAALMLKSKGRISTSSGDAAGRGKTTGAADVPPADGTKPKRKVKYDKSFWLSYFLTYQWLVLVGRRPNLLGCYYRASTELLMT